MSKCDKNLTAEAFCILGEKNIKCTIFVATNAYGMDIDNPNVKLILQWDFFLSFDLMIQRISHVGRKRSKATFALFIFKWSKIKNPDKIEKQLSKTSKTVTSRNVELSDSNGPISQAKISPLNQVLNADNDTSNIELVARSEAG